MLSLVLFQLCLLTVYFGTNNTYDLMIGHYSKQMIGHYSKQTRIKHLKTK